jgi:hypothetical protein
LCLFHWLHESNGGCYTSGQVKWIVLYLSKSIDIVVSDLWMYCIVLYDSVRCPGASVW